MRIPIQKLEGRDHFVAPMVMLVVGEFTGSGGPKVYTAEALANSVSLWNGKPVVVLHTQVNGEYVPAGSPQAFDRQRIGTIFNTSFDGRRLKAEAWIDVERVKSVDRGVYSALAAGQMMEVSTGLFADDVYNHAGQVSLTNFRPDHLAVLPDRKGACSIADGAGLCRNEHTQVKMIPMFLEGKGPQVYLPHVVDDSLSSFVEQMIANAMAEDDAAAIWYASHQASRP